MQLGGPSEHISRNRLNCTGVVAAATAEKKKSCFECKSARLLLMCACVPGAGVLLHKVREFDRRNFALGFMHVCVCVHA